MHEVRERNKNIALVIEFLALLTLLLSLLFVYVAIARAAAPIIREQRVQFGFQGQFEELVTTYTFGFDGSLNVENTRGFQFYFPQPRFQPALPVVVDVTENSSHVIQRFFVNGTDKHGQVQTLDLSVYFDFSRFEDAAKISLIGTTTDIDSEVEYEFENPRSAVVSNTTTSYQIGNVVFDWSDLQGATSFEVAANKLKVKFAAVFNLDPTIVSSALGNQATGFSYQRKLAYANGLWWAFYSDGTNIVYRTSSTGATWSSESTVGAVGGTAGSKFSIWQDGSTLHYVRHYNGLKYRRGTMNSDGTVSWAVAEQTVIVGGSGPAGITVNAVGYPFLIYSAGYQNWTVTKSAFNNGTWSTAVGFPFTLQNSAVSLFSGAHVIPLENGDVYALYAASVSEVWKGRLWNGTAWENEETVSTSLAYVGLSSSVVSIGNNLYFAYVTTEGIKFVQKTFGSAWTNETLLDANYATVSLSVANGVVYAFLQTDGMVSWTNYDGSSWSQLASFQDLEITAITLTSLYSVTSAYELGVIYTLKDSPYTVKFGKITTQEPVIDEPTVPGGTPTGEEEEPPANQTVTEKPQLPSVGLWGLIGAVGLIAVGGIYTATAGSSTHSSYRRPAAAHKTRYSPQPRPRKTRYSKVKG